MHTLIAPHLIERAQHTFLPPNGEPTWGQDVARYGTDNSVTGCRWPTGRYRRILRASKTDTRELSDIIEHEARYRKPQTIMFEDDEGPGEFEEDALPVAINVDVIGVGAGVHDNLKHAAIWSDRWGRKIRVCAANAAAKPRTTESAKGPKFLNARAEWFWNLREQFEAGEVDIDPEDEDLEYQLSEIRWKVNREGKIQIEDKEEFRRRTGVSPDDADAMAMSAAVLPSSEMVFL